MVMIGRFSSDDPGWREPWDREPERVNDDGDWVGLDPRRTRKGAKDRRGKGAKGKERGAGSGPQIQPHPDSPTSDF